MDCTRTGRECRLQSLPRTELLSVSETDRRQADRRRVAEHSPSEVLLLPDLAGYILGKLGPEDCAAAKVCSTWRAAWKATLHQRPLLRTLRTLSETLARSTLISLTTLPCGERACALTAANSLPDTARCYLPLYRLLVLGPDLRVTHSSECPAARGLVATEAGLYSWHDSSIARRPLEALVHDAPPPTATHEVTFADFDVDRVVSAPNGGLFASGTTSAAGGCIILLDGASLEEQKRFGGEWLAEPMGLAVTGDEIYVAEAADSHTDEEYLVLSTWPSRLVVFSHAGVYLRQVLVDIVSPIWPVGGELYTVDTSGDILLAPDGTLLTRYEHTLELAVVGVFAGSLVMQARTDSDVYRVLVLEGLC